MALEETIKSTLQKGEKITLMGFGVFLAKKRESRRAANPLNPKETILVPTVTVVKFRPGQHLKEAVKNSVSSDDRDILEGLKSNNAPVA